MKISVVVPIYLPSSKHKEMTDKCLYLAKEKTNLDPQWVIVETGSNYYAEEADLYLYEKEKTTPNISINRAFSLAGGDYVVFLANDVFVCDQWLELMCDCFRAFPDCGLASLGSNESGHFKGEGIEEGIYFSVSMMRKEDAWLDPNYDDLFDDTDLIMRLYARGMRCYKNYNGKVEHLRHATYGSPDLNLPKNKRQQLYFQEKWKSLKDNPVYRMLA